jgi:hypothetical protein
MDEFREWDREILESRIQRSNKDFIREIFYSWGFFKGGSQHERSQHEVQL